MTGKEKCKILKKIRKTIADNNGINYQITECPYEGECFGFCEKCDSEVRYLEAELKKRTDAGNTIQLYGLAYPSFLDSLEGIDSADDIANNSLYYNGAESKGEKVLSMSLEELGLSVRAYSCLTRANINTVEELIEMTESDLIRVRNLGKKSLDEIIQKLRALGLNLKEERIHLMGVPAPVYDGALEPSDEPLLMGDLLDKDPKLTDDEPVTMGVRRIRRPNSRYDHLFDDEDAN